MGDGVAAELSYGNIMDTLGDATYVANGCVQDIENGTTVENWYATEAYKKTCEMHRDWFVKGYSLPDSISNGYTVADSMMQGQVFSFFGRCSAGSNVAYWSAQTGKNLGSIPIGTGTYVLDTGSTMNTAWSISSSSENPQKTADFLELMYNSLEITNLLDLGIEGKHYVTREGSHIVGYPEGVDAGTVGYGHTIGTYGDQTDAYFREPLTDEFVDNLYLWGEDNAMVSRFMGYNFDTSSVSSEITAVIAEIGKYGPALNVGTVDAESMLPKFLEALDAAGMNKIIEENQRQLDAWLADHAE
jgi:putative aldouronate transport system substrate-binding protein